MKKRMISTLLALCITLSIFPIHAMAAEIIDTESNEVANEANTLIFNGHKYARIDQCGMTWADAKEFCESFGGHLATITTQEEQDSIITLLDKAPYNCYWIGATNEDGTWRWVTGEAFSYANWKRPEPANEANKEHYLEIYASTEGASKNGFSTKVGQWNDIMIDGHNGNGNNYEFYNPDSVGIICEWEFIPQGDADDPSRDESNISYFNNHSYMRVDQGMTWTEAKTACEDAGGHLVTITTDEEQKFIESLIKDGSKNHYWIGASDYEHEGIFTWVTGEDFSYSHWDPFNNEPNNGGGLGAPVSDEDYVQIYRVPNPAVEDPGEASKSIFGGWNDISNDCHYPNQDEYFGIVHTGYICEWEDTYPGFNEYIFHAETALSGSDENYVRWQEYLQGKIGDSDSPAKVTVDAWKNTNCASIAEGWYTATTIIDSIVSSPSVGIKQLTVKQEDIYTAIILDALESSYKIGIANSVKKDSKEVLEWSGWVLKTIAEAAQIEIDSTNQNWSVFVGGKLNETQKKYIAETIALKYDMDYGKLSDGSNFIKYINKALDVTANVESFVENCFAFYNVLQLSEEMQFVVQKMYEDCPVSNTPMRVALKKCNEVIDAGFNRFAETMIGEGLVVSGRYVVLQLADMAWGSVIKQVESLFPIVAVLKLVYQAGKYMINELTNNDALVEAYNKLIAVLDFEDLGRVVMNRLAIDFNLDTTESNAKKYLESARLNFKILDTDADYAINFYKEMQKGLVAEFQEMLNGSKIEGIIEQIDTYKNLIQLARAGFDSFWILHLADDYPELFAQYAPRLQETLKLNKQVTVSCPVDVCVYDKNNDPVAYIKDGLPYATGNITVVVDGENKNFYFYDDEAYEIKCEGYDSGTMDILINEYEGDSVAREVNYLNIPVDSTSLHDLEIKENEITLLFSGEIVASSYDSQNDAPRYTITINNGFATTNRTFENTLTAKEGEIIDISSYVPKEYYFSGWVSDSDDLMFANANTPSTYFTMVDHDVVINALLSSATTTVHTVTLDSRDGSDEKILLVSNGDGTLDFLPSPERDGFTFSGWYTDIDDGVEVTTATVFTEDTTIYAHWTKSETGSVPPELPGFSVSVTASPTDGGTVTGDGTYEEGKRITVTATPASGYRFVKWVENGTEVSTNATYSFTIASDRTLIAVFEKAPENPEIPVASISVTPDAVEIAVGATKEVAATILPENATNKNVQWSSEDERIAVVSETGIILAKALGTTTVYAVTADGGYSAAVKVTVVSSASGTGGGGTTSPASSAYPITITQPKHGTVKASSVSAVAGSNVIITVMPDDGYVLGSLTVTDSNGKVVSVTDNGDGTYTLTMPRGGVAVNATFKLKLCDGGVDCPSHNYTDVDHAAWYHEGVDYAIANKLMFGKADGIFAPDGITTRAEMVTILYRLDGEPAVTKDVKFDDVPSGQWYSDAINWAAANEIVGGYGDGKFGPDDTITREQMAAILYRYASCKGYDMTKLDNLSGYTDADTVSDWADTAVKWAVAEGIINGTSTTTLSPSGDSTRAQVAAIFMRFGENIVK